MQIPVHTIACAVSNSMFSCVLEQASPFYGLSWTHKHPLLDRSVTTSHLHGQQWAFIKCGQCCMVKLRVSLAKVHVEPVQGPPGYDTILAAHGAGCTTAKQHR
jgi:hypothetical protein